MSVQSKQPTAAATAARDRPTVHERASEITADLRDRGDTAVRQYSENCDNWSPESFRLSSQRIAEIIATVPGQVIADTTVRATIRAFAKLQPDSLTDLEADTQPGVWIEHAFPSP